VLLRTLFVLVLFTALSETIVHGAHALAQSLLQREAAMATRQELAATATQARAAIAAVIASGVDPRDAVPAAPSPVATCVVTAATDGCALEATATIAFSASAPSTASPCPSDGCTIYEQNNDAVTEGRTTADVTAKAVTSSGAILAARSQRLVFRTWRVAPYAALGGAVDESLEGVGQAGAGDDGGAVPNGTAPGTLIDVLYENQRTGATMPANVWHPEIQTQAVTPPVWSP
jgi:hypothetical protein